MYRAYKIMSPDVEVEVRSIGRSSSLLPPPHTDISIDRLSINPY